MSRGRGHRRADEASDADASASAPAPGKRASTDRLVAQRRAIPPAAVVPAPPPTALDDPFALHLAGAPVAQRAADVGAGVDGAAPAPTGGGAPLPADLRGSMERSFASDFSSVRVHEGAHATAVGALAYTQGDDVHFAPGQYDPGSESGRQLLGHELAHVVQQREGRVAASVQHKGLALNDDPALEREADEQGARAAAGEVVRTAAGPQPTSGSGPIQRHAIVAGAHVPATSPGLTAEMTAIAKDPDKVYGYLSQAEFEQHAAGRCDYLGHLPDGTWMRFAKDGINLIGENHADVTLEKILPAVKSTSFIYEPFATDKLDDGSELAEAYEAQNKDRFAAIGGKDAKLTADHGAESLYPKLGVAMSLGLPYFRGSKPLDELTATGGYVGQPVQRGVKMAWAHASDVWKRLADPPDSVEDWKPPVHEQMVAGAYQAHRGALDVFIDTLGLEGHLGDSVVAHPKPGALLEALAAFATTFIDAMVARATDPDNGLSKKQRDKLGKARSKTDEDKKDLLWQWRDMEFAKAIQSATARKVRYAGMGQLHLEEFARKPGLKADQHAFYMADASLATFRAETEALEAKVKP